MLQSLRAIVALILIGTILPLLASTAAIGFVTANGSFQMNAKPARGSATLFDGSAIETGKVPSQMRLANGAQFRLAIASRATIYASRAVLEKGAGQLESSSAYLIEGRTLRVASTEPDTVARVQLGDEGQVMVAVLRGSVQVANSAGVVVANLKSGLSMAFDPQVGADAPARVSGCVFHKDSKDFVYDAATRVAVEIRGDGLVKQVGKNVEVSGVQDPATRRIAVTTLKQLAGGNCAKFAKVAAASGLEAASAAVAVAGTAAGAAAGAGIGAATAATVIGGVAAAATVSGLAASGTFSGSQSATPTSR